MKLTSALLLSLLALGCASSASTQVAGDRLARELPTLYPGVVIAASFENNPPLDPATLFVDLAPSMGDQEQLRFLCDEIRPHVTATRADIDVTVSYGWHIDDC